MHVSLWTFDLTHLSLDVFLLLLPVLAGTVFCDTYGSFIHIYIIFTS